jgi:hypothetical protein
MTARCQSNAASQFVMAGLVPAIHAFSLFSRSQGVDARHKAGHDGREVRRLYSNPSTIRTSRSAPLPSAFSALW